MLTTTANGKEELNVQPGVLQNVDGVQVVYYPRWTKDHSQFSPGLLAAVWRDCKKYDTVHIHSWWNLSVMFSVLICWLRGVRPILSPHGMLSDFSFNKSHGGIKNIFHKYIGSFLLRQTHMHLTSVAEQKQLGGINEDNFVLPNFIETADNPELQKKENDIFTLIFLSRIHPKKNIEGLIDALAIIDFNIKLQIVGPGEKEYIEELKKRAEEKNVAKNIEWLGELHGDIKFQHLAAADIFVLTSHNENFALVVTEALSAGTPVLVSENVGLANYVKENDLGWLCSTEADNIAQAIKSAYTEKEKRAAIRKKAPAKIQHDFSPKVLSDRYTQQYNRLKKHA